MGERDERHDAPVLIVAAWAPELRGLGRVFSQTRAAPPERAVRPPPAPRRTLTPARPAGERVAEDARPPAGAIRVTGAAPVRAVVGVGLCEAAAGAARLIERQRPRAVILIGTAGVYPGADRALSIGAAAIVRGLHLASGEVARDAAYLPEPLPASCSADADLVAELASATGLAIADVACPLAISKTAALARELRKSTGADLENLEAFAVARAALSASVPFTAVLGIANTVGPDAHAEWKTHATAAANAACTAVRTWLARG